MKNIFEAIKMEARAGVIRDFGSPEARKKLLDDTARLPNEQLDMMAALSGIREEHVSIFKKQLKGEENSFTKKLNGFEHELKTGDIILMTGTSIKSQILAKSQKSVYLRAKSSHVAIVHADFICVDAMPDIGVTCRIISDVLTNVENDWRVIRFNNLKNNGYESLLKACSYYMNQPYKIRPSKKPAKKFSYCSELVRKVYTDSKIIETGIPANIIIKPCDFDRLADHNSNWSDVTQQVKPFIEFCQEYDDIIRMISNTFIQGLELNRHRFEDRKKWRQQIKMKLKSGTLSPDKATALLNDIDSLEGNLNHQFWDIKK